MSHSKLARISLAAKSLESADMTERKTLRFIELPIEFRENKS